MIAGLGLDVASVDRIRAILEGRHGERFARRICTESLTHDAGIAAAVVVLES